MTTLCVYSFFSVANLFVHFMHDSTEFHHIRKDVDMYTDTISYLFVK